MARYIKVNPKVAKYLHLENDRNTVTDGNYLLWQADMLAFGNPIDFPLPLILAQIGGIALMAHEAKEEQDGTVCRELPVATDPRFVVEPVSEEEDEDGQEADGADPIDAGQELEPDGVEDGQSMAPKPGGPDPNETSQEKAADENPDEVSPEEAAEPAEETETTNDTEETE